MKLHREQNEPDLLLTVFLTKHPASGQHLLDLEYESPYKEILIGLQDKIQETAHLALEMMEESPNAFRQVFFVITSHYIQQENRYSIEIYFMVDIKLSTDFNKRNQFKASHRKLQTKIAEKLLEQMGSLIVHPKNEPAFPLMDHV